MSQLNETDHGERDRHLRDRLQRVAKSHPILSNVLMIEVLLLCAAIVFAAIGGQQPGPGINLLHMFSGLAVIMMMILVLGLAVAGGTIYAHRGIQQVADRVPV